MDKRWAQASARRDQLVLFAESVDELVGLDDPVRVLDEMLGQVDWQAWEMHYNGHLGQPPLHPRVMAGAILFGLMNRVRSSRDLESATRNRIDFKWLLEGRIIDHSTFALFRKDFGAEIKVLFEQIAKLICNRRARGLEALVVDGTRMRANSDRHGARTAQWLEHRVAHYTQELEKRLRQLASADEEEEEWAEGASREELEGEAARLLARLEKCERALAQARARDAAKQAKDGAKAVPVRVPVTDPDSMIVQNKEGGFAPNYTPTVAVDLDTGIIVCAEVPEGSQESAAVVPALAQAHRLGLAPQCILADSGFATGENLHALEEQGVAAYMPTDTEFKPGNPALREDPSQAVPEATQPELPCRGGKLARAAFVYDASANAYRCPTGTALLPNRQTKTGITTYQCPGKAGCPLGPQCVQDRAAARTVQRDPCQDLRDAAGRRMSTPEGKALYRKRAPVVEGVFARLKHHMGIRRFHLRGLKRVRTEWTWICTAYNLKRWMGIKAAQALLANYATDQTLLMIATITQRTGLCARETVSRLLRPKMLPFTTTTTCLV